MALDKRKFTEKSFVDHVPIDLFAEFLAPFKGQLNGLDLDALTPESLYDYLVGVDDSYPAEMVEALHRMNDVRGNGTFERVLELADEHGARERILAGADEPPLAELIMRSYLYARPEVFEPLWDQEFLHSLDFPYDRVGSEPCPVEVTDEKLEAFRQAIFWNGRDSLRGKLCTVRHYQDGDDDYFLVRTGWTPDRLNVDEDGQEKVISFRPVHQDVIHYDGESGKVRMKTTTRKLEEQDALRDLFARHVLGKPDLFQHEAAAALYTLEPIKRDGLNFRFTEGLHPDDRVSVIEVKVAVGEGRKRVRTTVANKEDALAVIARDYPAIDLTAPTTEILSIRLQFRLVRGNRIIRRTVHIVAPCHCTFNEDTWGDTIWNLLNRNGFMLQRGADAVAV
jgi:hypothetical protein